MMRPAEPVKIVTDIRFAALVLFAVSLDGCNRGSDAPLPPGAIVFAGSGIALVPGDGWKIARTGDFTAGSDICLPVLEGDDQKGVIQVYTSSTKSDPHARATLLRADIEAQPKFVPGTYQQEDFTTAGGLTGVHSYYDLTVEVQGKLYKSRNHLYLVANKQGRCIGVSYTTVPSKDLQEVHQMIQKTLILH